MQSAMVKDGDVEEGRPLKLKSVHGQHGRISIPEDHQEREREREIQSDCQDCRSMDLQNCSQSCTQHVNPGSLGRQSEAEETKDQRATKLLKKKEDEAACCSSVNSLHHQNDGTCLNVHFIPQIAKRVFLKSAGRFFVIRSGLRVSGFCYV